LLLSLFLHKESHFFPVWPWTLIFSNFISQVAGIAKWATTLILSYCFLWLAWLSKYFIHLSLNISFFYFLINSFHFLFSLNSFSTILLDNYVMFWNMQSWNWSWLLMNWFLRTTIWWHLFSLLSGLLYFLLYVF
jgi:hypothetical protein